MEKKIIISLVGIIIVLGAVFFGRQAYTQGFGKNLVSDATSKAQAYLAKGSDWAMSTIYPKVSGEVAKRGDMIKNEVAQEQQKVSENIGTKIKNYFSGIADSVVHPGTPQNCQPAETPAAK
jgi:predicted PurR-regulated permease PerM